MNTFIREAIRSSPLGLRQEAKRVIRLPRFEAQVEKLSMRLNLSQTVVRSRAQQCLREMVTLDSQIYTWLFDNLLSPAHTRAFTVDADHEMLARLKQLGEQHPLVFLPSHRSYADFFINSKVMREHGLKRTHTLGGDNLKFFPIEQIAQHSGGVFIRRSFKDDEIYKAMLQEYLTDLVSRGDNLEWYMEGGRSRTGKLRPPKYGLLNYLVHALKSGAAKDVILVPTSITYDQLHEVQAMMSQEMTGKKPKEGLSWLLNYARTQQQWIGLVHVRYGEPLSLAERLNDIADDPERKRYLIEKTAFEVFKRINSATPVTAQALVTLALLSADGLAVTLHQVHRQLSPLLNYAKSRGLPAAQVSPLGEVSGVRETLSSLVRTGVVALHSDGTEPVYTIAEGQHGVAAYYRNSAIHWFINRAILELGMWKAAHSGASDLVKAGKHETLALRDLLKFEFIFSDRSGFREELLQESDLFDPEWRQRIATKQQRLEMLADAPFLIAYTVLPTFLEAYFVLADRLAARKEPVKLDDSKLLDECMAVGHQYLLQGKLHNPECLSRELFSNALRLAANRGHLDDASGRASFSRECQDLVTAVHELGRMARQKTSIGPDEHESKPSLAAA